MVSPVPLAVHFTQNLNFQVEAIKYYETISDTAYF
jgi:hypothetical protein